MFPSSVNRSPYRHVSDGSEGLTRGHRIELRSAAGRNALAVCLVPRSKSPLRRGACGYPMRGIRAFDALDRNRTWNALNSTDFGCESSSVFEVSCRSSAAFARLVSSMARSRLVFVPFSMPRVRATSTLTMPLARSTRLHRNAIASDGRRPREELELEVGPGTRRRHVGKHYFNLVEREGVRARRLRLAHDDVLMQGLPHQLRAERIGQDLLQDRRYVVEGLRMRRKRRLRSPRLSTRCSC